MAINIFTDLDSLWDTRRMILHKLANEHGRKDFDWNSNFADIYKRRKYDIYEYPEFGITEETFISRFEKRSKEDWVDLNTVYAIPSKLIAHLFPIVREIEFGVGKMFQTDSFNLTINTFPYQLSDSEKGELESVIRAAIKFTIGLNFVFIKDEDLEPNFLHAYNYVFKYNFLVSKAMESYWKKYGNSLNTGTKFIVPELYARKTALPTEMESETPGALISKLNAAQGGKITIISVPVSVFDYKE
ncbi:hypothetical protein [Aeromonas phage AerS_266]|nr:hypothetical protein [Aeromonas phage AerS_266]